MQPSGSRSRFDLNIGPRRDTANWYRLRNALMLTTLIALPSPAVAAIISFSGSATVVESVNFAEFPLNTVVTFSFSWDDTAPNFDYGTATIAFGFPNSWSASSNGPVYLSASSGFSNMFQLSAPTPDSTGFSFIDSITITYAGAFLGVPSALPPLGTAGYGPLTLYVSSHSIDTSRQICLDEPTLPGCDIPLTIRAEATTLEQGTTTTAPEPGTLSFGAVAIAAWCGRRYRRR